MLYVPSPRFSPLVEKEDYGPRILSYHRELINRVCHKCNFYAEDQEYWESEYECGAYKFIRKMVENGTITLDEIEDIFKGVDLNPERDLK